MNTTPDPFFDFEWPVAPDYRWVEWLGSDGRPVRPNPRDLDHPNTYNAFEEKKGEETGPILMPVEGRSQLIHPMDRDHASLFRRFADLDATDLDGILRFARQYGWLGVTPRPSQVIPKPGGRSHHAGGEPHLLWVSEIAQMRRAIWLWEHPKFTKSEEGYFAWLFNRHLQTVQPRMIFTSEGLPQLRFAPLNLLAAMWLQLAMAVAEKKTFIKCRFCDRQIEISTAQSGFRSNRTFCSQSCKTMDYRRRKREAIKQGRRGKSLGAIAKLVATETTTVRRWLAAAQRGKTAARLRQVTGRAK